MAYSDDAVQAKLNSLNESQDSIVANAQWIMFHRRHAARTAALWLARLQDATMPKRLNLIYLANEVVQQSRARGKQDFMLAFEPIISEGTALAYKGASQDVQGKLRRVVEVWRQRGIFGRGVMEGVEQRLAEVDKQRSGKTGGGARLGGSLFGGGANGSVPSELEEVSKSLAGLTKAEVLATPAVNTANAEYTKITDPNTTLPTPPVYAARLSAVMKELATAQGAVEASIKARQELLSGLEKLVESNRTKLLAEEATFAEISTRKDGIESKKREVEDGIMRGLSAPSTPGLASSEFTDQPNGGSNGHQSSLEPERPEAEGFTPPPPDVESFTPPAEDSVMPDEELPLEQPFALSEPPPAQESAAAAAQDFLSNLNLPATTNHASSEPTNTSSEDTHASGDPRLKRRKMSHKSNSDTEEDIFGSSGGAGVDEDGITAMLGP